MKTENFRTPHQKMKALTTMLPRPQLRRMIRRLPPTRIVWILALVTARVALGETTSSLAPRRPAKQAEQPVLVIKEASEKIEQALMTLGSQGEGLASATAAYKADATTQNAIGLFQAMATAALAGSKTTATVAEHASRIAQELGELARRCENEAQQLSPASAKAKASASENKAAASEGFAELRRIRQTIKDRRVEDDGDLAPGERERIAGLLRAVGAADLGERLASMEAVAIEDVVGRLRGLGQQFRQKEAAFKGMRDDYEVHKLSFNQLAVTSANLSELYARQDRYQAEGVAAEGVIGSLTTSLTTIDNILGGMVSDFPARIGGPAMTNQSTMRGRGLLDHLERILGGANEPEAKKVAASADE